MDDLTARKADPQTQHEFIAEALQQCRYKQQQAMQTNSVEQLSQLLDHEHRLLELLAKEQA